MSIPRCPNCGAQIFPGDAFCPTCGAKLQPAPVATPSSPRRRSGWRRPVAILAIVFLVGIGAVIGVMLRTTAAVDTVQTISRPPASLPASALGRGETGQIDTAPARTATAGSMAPDLDWWTDIGDTVERFRQTASGVAVAAGGQATAPEAMTILLLGVDARDAEAIDVGVRPDAIAVLHLDPVAGTCRVLAIPRDTRVELPGYGLSKVNHALAVGGIPYQTQVVESLLGLTLDRYALVDFRGFADVIDLIGGITITVAEPFTLDDITFAAGEQRLNGEQALAYVRYRGGEDGDFGRIARQQQVLQAVAQQATSLNLIQTARDLLPAVEDHFRTNLSPMEITGLVLQYQSGCGGGDISMETLAGTTASFPDPLVGQALSYVVVDEAEIRAKVAILLGE